MRPNADGTFDIGSTSNRWRQLFVDQITVTGTATAGANIGGRFRIENTEAASGYNDYTTSFRADGGAVVRGALYVNSTGNFNGAVTGTSFTDGTLTISGGDITSGTGADFSGVVDVGSLVSSGSVSGTSGSFTGDVDLGNATSDTITMTGRVDSDIVPSTDNARDLGSSSLKWNDVYATTFQGTATSAQYADLAEIYSSDKDYEPGTVVKLGGEKEVTETDSFNDPEVFGVVSTSPAYLMNSEAEGVAVALSGRVPCKVEGRIKKGERLVSGSKPGFAKALGSNEYDMRSIVGRALVEKDTFDDAVIEIVVGVK